MKNITFKVLHDCSIKDKTKQRFHHTGCNTFRYCQQNAGFSLIELIVVVLIIGILAAIAAPGWLGFVNRQRVNKANDIVLAALQEAQREAKRTKLSYSVSIKTGNNAEIAIHPDASGPNNYWRKLGQELQIQPELLILGSNLTDENADGAMSYASENEQKITFDYIGALPNANLVASSDDPEEAHGLKIVVAIPQPSDPTSASSLKRCVIVKTILGSMITEKDDNCN